MNLNTKKGEKIKYLGRNGHDRERKFANTILKVGNIYEVENIRVGNRSSEVKLKGITKVFNTVMFENIIKYLDTKQQDQSE